MILSKEIIKKISQELGNNFQIYSSSSIGGGSINQAVHIKSNLGNFFIKWNNAKAFPQMFEKEAQSLEILRNTDSIRIPKVILINESENESFLLLEYIEQGSPKPDFWFEFAQSLAILHQNNSDFYGLDFDNYIGSLPQLNKQHGNWIDFFVEERLLPQIRSAHNNGLLQSQHHRNFEKLFSKLETIFPNEKPSLIHGDLWSGNFMIDEKGNACIFDPAIYYGNRIMDIAMSKMFGGFSSDFYQFYNECFPMENNWEEQIEIANLYPYLVHLNLFGLSYLSGINAVLRRFV